MTFQGLFWSAILRSLLSLRRDLQIQNESDQRVLDLLDQVESQQIDSLTLDTLLNSLIPPSDSQLIGRSLAGYFDFNKMGNLIVYMISTRNIQSALAMFEARSQSLLTSKATIVHSEVPSQVTIEWASQGSDIQDELSTYFLLIVFRHLAGRRFDFDKATLISKGNGILGALSQARLKYANSVSISFNPAWLTTPSFYHSPAIESLLEPALAVRPQTFQQQLLNTFAKTSMPARIRADWVAEQLGISQAALRKALKVENITFSDLLKSYTHGFSCQRLLQSEKTDEVAIALGFSDRRSFERSFKAFSGINAGQLRQLGARLRFARGNDNLLSIVDNLPPLPATIQAIISIDEDKLTLPHVVSLIKKDPIFHAHIMSKAGKAIYGGHVTSLEQAVGRNLGVGNIKNLALLFAAQQQLSEQCRHPRVEGLTDAMLFSDLIFSALTEAHHTINEREHVRQQLLFGVLAIFLLFHEDCVFADGVLRMWQESESFLSFSRQLSSELGICLYGASSLMLLRWGFGHDTNHALWQLCKQLNDTTENEIITAHNIAFTALAADQRHNAIRLVDDPAQSKVSHALERWSYS